ncbi:hypothetical protein [Streptomyces sp. SID10815]|uniref:hypothetical protein n=1 Tax=Streptomyces sp. SID10815 TaxID=2706027 RepID=UPI0013CDCDA6|nr:hypothetical protein [Streptomyces sp. SID10815]NEA52414.1 hypothetical protein [Streptomyces sp. SID10815]
MSDVSRLADRLQRVLARAQEERTERDELVDGPDGTECAWAAHERDQMWKAVNALRADDGRPSIPLDDIVQVERQAAGHSDYSRKFALYCAELAQK